MTNIKVFNTIMKIGLLAGIILVLIGIFSSGQGDGEEWYKIVYDTGFLLLIFFVVAYLCFEVISLLIDMRRANKNSFLSIMKFIVLFILLIIFLLIAVFTIFKFVFPCCGF